MMDRNTEWNHPAPIVIGIHPLLEGVELALRCSLLRAFAQGTNSPPDNGEYRQGGRGSMEIKFSTRF
jgi:hypothetical protein